MNWPWQLPPPEETLKIAFWAIVVLILCALGYAKFLYETNSLNDFGFGPHWHCAYPPRGEPICVKDTAK
jgi:hypothetical protein